MDETSGTLNTLSDVTTDVYVDDVTETLPWSIYDNMPMVRFVCGVALSFPIAAFGIFGNILAFVVLCRQPQRLTTNVLLQALAVADTLVLVSSILLRSMRYVGWDDYNDIHHYIFVVLYPSVYFFRLADTWLTVMMTIDRYIAVCHPLKAQRFCTLHRTYVTIAIIVMATLIFSIPRAFEYRLFNEEYFGSGFINTHLVKHLAYTITYRIILFFCVMYVVPIGLMIVLSTKLLTELSRAYRRAYRHHSVHRVNGIGAHRTGRSITAIVITIVTIYVTCNTLAMVTHLLWAISTCFDDLIYLDRHRRILANISNVMVTTNCAVNFPVYCAVSSKFRSALKRLFRCGSCCRGSYDRHHNGIDSDVTRDHTNLSMLPLDGHVVNVTDPRDQDGHVTKVTDPRDVDDHVTKVADPRDVNSTNL